MNVDDTNAMILVFALCIDLDAIPFSLYVLTTQKLPIVSFAAWAGWVAWRLDRPLFTCVSRVPGRCEKTA